jgi:broad specificity phosphatase PhoE
MLMLDAVSKSTPSIGMVHRDQPLKVRRKDDPGTDPMNPDTVEPGLEEGIQDPFDYRDLNEDNLPKEKDDKKDDDPGTQDVDPPNQSAVDIGPLDVIVPQDSFGPIEKRISGNSQIRLNVEGRKLANKLADRIAAKGCLDVIYSSTLPRGIETVEPILKACPTTKYAGPQPDLCPWKLGVYEGKEPDDVKSQIVYFIEHPDEVPPGKGADGEPAESFNDAKRRQLGFFRKVYEDYTSDPTLKIGVQTHSRGQELLMAWVDADCPDDYDLDEKDVIHPDDQPHATMMRWHKDDIKDIDLDSDDPLKPGVYLILHSLTDDDTDGGNPELEKYDADQPRDDHGRFGSAQIQLGIAQDEHDRLKEHPGREDDNASAAAKSNFSRGVYALGDKVRALAAKPAFNVKINRSGDKARPVIMNHIARGDKARADAVRDPEGGAWKMDMALSHYHDAILTAGRVLGSKWVGKADYKPGKDMHGTQVLYHGTSAPLFAYFNDGLVYLAADPKETKVFAENPIAGGGRGVGPSRTLTVVAAGGTRKDISSEVDDALVNDEDVDEVIGREADKARAEGHSYVTFNHPSGVEGRDEFQAIVSLNPKKDLKISGNDTGDGKWVTMNGRHVLLKSDIAKRMYMPPIEVHRAAKSAIDSGVSVLDITYPLAESRGLPLDHVQMIADFFAASESATAPPMTRNAYGGINAVKWAAKVIAKAHKEYSSWYGCDLDGTLCKPAESYDGTAIGAPIKTMIDKVKSLIACGKEVRIFTACIADDVDGKKEAAIKAWCKTHIGRELPVTNEKDPGMVALWDDRAHNADEINKAGSGVMVAFMLDAATADKLKVPGGEDPKDMHVTLAYLGKLDTLDMSTLPGLEQAIKSYAAMHAPVTGTIDGPIRFSAKPQTEGRDVCVAALCNVGIQEFRAGLVDAIKGAGVEVPRVFDYRPHVCIKYIPTDADMPVQRIAPMPVTFNAITLSVGGARKTYPLSGTVVKYSPDQPRADNGEFGSGSGTRAKASDRVERARKSAVLIGTKEQRQAEGVEAKFAKAIGVPQTKDNNAFDLRNDAVGIELKTLLSNSNDKITMNKYAIGRKVAEQRADNLKVFTVVADMRGRSNAAYYVREGVGSFRLGSMTKVTLSQLKDKVRNV